MSIPRLMSTLLAVAAGLLIACSAMAQPLPHLALARVNVPVEGPGLPYYARLSRSGDSWVMPRNEAWSVLVFYRDPQCIPDNFDLTQGVHFPGPDGLGAIGCRPLFEGFDLRFSTLDPMMPPDYSYMRNGTLDLPIWFIDTAELDALLERGFVYLPEIAALPSRVSGRAWQFEEQIQPLGANPEPSVRISASGRLDDGGRFSFFWFYKSAVPDPFDLSTATLLESVFDLDADLPDPPPPPPGAGVPPEWRALCAVQPRLPICG